MDNLTPGKSIIKHFIGTNNHFFVSEFAHSIKNRSYKAGPHIRNEFIIHINVKGGCTFSGIHAGEGECFLFCDTLIHSLITDSTNDRYWICFRGEQVKELLRIFCIPTDRHVHFRIRNTTLVNSTLEQMFLACQNASKNEDGEQYAMVALMTVLTQLEMNTAVEPSPDYGYVLNVARIIDSRYYQNLSMEQLARQIHISEKHMCRLFKKELGLTPKGYLLKVRMDSGKNLLLTTQNRIGDIAVSVGYPSQMEFSKVFKRYFGVTPSAMRKNGVPVPTHPLNWSGEEKLKKASGKA